MIYASHEVKLCILFQSSACGSEPDSELPLGLKYTLLEDTHGHEEARSIHNDTFHITQYLQRFYRKKPAHLSYGVLHKYRSRDMLQNGYRTYLPV